MGAPADHFAAFVAQPGQHERVARAVAGEPWARFCRRVLLERAAYRMLATDDTIGDIAATSGLGSQEVFTRAFRREYGANPSAWRAEPTSYRIDAPNDVHFHPPAGLRLPARQRMDGVDLVVELVEQHVRLVGELVDRAALVSPDDLDREPEHPVPGGGTLRRTLSRLIDQMERLSALVHDTDEPRVGVDESVPAMRGRLDRVGPAFVDDVSLLAATGRLDETVVDAGSPTPQVLSYGAMVTHVLTVAAHDRLLALLRLRESGVTDLGSADPQHWFAVGR